MICNNCKQEFGQIAGYHVSHLDKQWDFCGRICLVEGMTPEVKRAIVVSQWFPRENKHELTVDDLVKHDHSHKAMEYHWIPTPEEEERMSQ